MIRTAYNKGFVDALQHFHADVTKFAQGNAASAGSMAPGAAPAGGMSSQAPAPSPITTAAPSQMSTTPSAPNARATL